MVASVVGSSPLTRGTPKNNVRWYLNGRFIPAYAGNSLVISKLKPSFYGSSPLTRGTQRTIENYIERRRFIPAYAGNSQ